MDTNALLRQLPKVDSLLERPDIQALEASAPRTLVIEAVREALDATRQALLSGVVEAADADAIAAAVIAHAQVKARRSLRRVINATGIVVHTNLGRSPLAAEAIDAVVDVSAGYSTLEYDVEAGERGSRHSHVEGLICRLTGAEAAMAVNNNAAAVVLAIAGLARGKEAVVSRGQLVEIGGSFRVPDVMRESGATMIEVGTTNKTHARDYENAITPQTGLLLKVHTSNYRVVGFTNEVSLAELVEIGRARGVSVMEDQGSGVLVDLRELGLPYEPTVAEAVATGADVVTCSGDKLFGGPQAGILCGRAEVIGALKKHPFARALRLDKMTLAALEATLRLYLDPARAVREIPTLRMLAMSPREVAAQAAKLTELVRAHCGDAAEVAMLEDVSRAGGGALPMADIPTTVVAVVPRSVGVGELEARLRAGEPPVVARIADGALRFDPRTLTGSELVEVAEALARALAL